MPVTLALPSSDPSPITVFGIVVHLVLLGLVLASVAGVFFKSYRPAHVGDVLLTVGLIVVTTVLCIGGAVNNAIYRPFLLGYMFFVWGVAGTAGVMSYVRLQTNQQALAVLWVVGSLLTLGCLIALLLPAVPQAREPARRSQCKNNLKQIGLAMHNWHTLKGRLPDSQIVKPDHPPMSWRVALLPYVGENDLQRQYDDTMPWDDQANLGVAQTRMSIYSCPETRFRRHRDQDDQQRYFTAYAAVAGPQTAFPEGRGLTLDEIADGLSHTILVAEACGQEIVWTRPADLDTAAHPIGINLPGERPTHSPGILSSYHPQGGAHVALADGSVRFVSDKIDPQVLKAATTATGGEPPVEW